MNQHVLSRFEKKAKGLIEICERLGRLHGTYDGLGEGLIASPVPENLRAQLEFMRHEALTAMLLSSISLVDDDPDRDDISLYQFKCFLEKDKNVDYLIIKKYSFNDDSDYHIQLLYNHIREFNGLYILDREKYNIWKKTRNKKIAHHTTKDIQRFPISDIPQLTEQCRRCGDLIYAIFCRSSIEGRTAYQRTYEASKAIVEAVRQHIVMN